MQPFYAQSPTNINIMITSSQNKLKGVLIQTCLSRLVNGLATPATAGGAGFSTMESPYTPSLCMKNSSLWTNTNLKIGGINYYPQNLDYSYQMYQDNIKDLVINGGLTQELGSCLISESDFRNCYGFLYFDLQRLKSNEAEWMLSKSLEFTGKLNTLASAIDINAFYVYENEMTIDVSSSQRSF